MDWLVDAHIIAQDILLQTTLETARKPGHILQYPGTILREAISRFEESENKEDRYSLFVILLLASLSCSPFTAC